MLLHIDTMQRNAKMRAHTATHLLHFALGKLLWTTKQAWSWVDRDLLRFDFATQRTLEVDELVAIQDQVLSRIKADIPVSIQEMTMTEATALWAKAFFEDKYWERVRVVSIITPDETLRSLELCGGTHVVSTWYIGAFAILSQESVASGTRRITACTWPEVAQALTHAHQLIARYAQKLWCQTKQIDEKIEKILLHHQELISTHEAIENKYYTLLLSSLPHKPTKDWCIDQVINLSQLWLKDDTLKTIVSVIKTVYTEKNILLTTQQWWFALRVNRAWMSAKTIIQQRWVTWGWSDALIQWKDERILSIE
jgi:alanyl-tRNA synthetase